MTLRETHLPDYLMSDRCGSAANTFVEPDFQEMRERGSEQITAGGQLRRYSV